VKVDAPPKNDTPPVKVDEPPKNDTPVKVDAPPKNDTPVKVDAPPKNDTPPKNVDPPKKKGITTEQLAARLKKIENQLASKEAETGQKDNVVRQFLDQAKKQIQRANTDAERKEAWGFLGDIEAQLKH
jgi:hypothetical protein